MLKKITIITTLCFITLSNSSISKAISCEKNINEKVIASNSFCSESSNDKCENDNIMKSSGVIRKGKSLKIKIGSKFKVFSDYEGAIQSIDYAETYRHFLFVTRLEDYGFYVIRKNSYEWFDHILVDDQTGKEYKLAGDIILSPDRKKLLVFSSTFGIEGFEIWSIGKRKLKIEKTKKYNKIISSISWADNKTICINNSNLLKI